MRDIPLKAYAVSVAIAALLSTSISAQSISVGQSSIRVNEDFKAKLYISNVYCWIDGKCKGPVQGKYGALARTFDRLLRGTQRYADFAIYGIHKQDWLFKGMNDALKRKVRVRSVVDQRKGALGDWSLENFTYPQTAYLPRFIGESAVVPDLNESGTVRTSSVMHNKFAVLDRRYLWMGSMNFSPTGIGAEYNANSVLLVDSEALAIIYAQEFYQMFEKKRFSRTKRPRGKRLPLVYNDGTRVSVFFSPQDNPLEAAVIPFIRSARSALDIAMFYLTDARIAEEIMAAIQRGVRVRLLADAVAARNKYSKHAFIRQAGAQVKVENWGGKMHMKTVVADGVRLLIGSMNWSAAGSTKNDENTIVIDNNSRLALEFAKHFNALWVRTPDTPANVREPMAESMDSINSCFDGTDNDHDGKIDMADPGCASAVYRF